MNMQAELKAYQQALRSMGTDPAPLAARAEALVNLPDSEFEQALKVFGAAADHRSYYVPALDSDYGAMLLEALADICPDPLRKHALYLGAQARAALFASYATAGGEGLARMMDVHRIQSKLDDLDSEEVS
jgi:hypothetical protein